MRRKEKPEVEIVAVVWNEAEKRFDPTEVPEKKKPKPNPAAGKRKPRPHGRRPDCPTCGHSMRAHKAGWCTICPEGRGCGRVG